MKVRERNHYVDLFRGIALICIYIDHIPGNPLGTITIHRLGFFDAAEVFVFLAGYASAKAFGKALEANPLLGVMHVLQRCWTLYVVHIFLFVFFIAQVSWTAERFQNPLLAEEMRITSILDEPYIAVMRALTLEFQPAFLDILPLYILLLLAFTPVFFVLRWSVAACLVLSLGVWLLAQAAGLKLPTYPAGVWLFNPFAWQAVFVAGMAVGWEPEWRLDFWNRWLVGVSLAIAGAALLIRNGVEIADRLDRLPHWLASAVWPLIDKANLGPLRLISFLALAHVVAWFLRDRPQPTSRWAKPFIKCGRNSLYIFCLGLVLSFLAHLVLVEIDDTWSTLVVLNGGGIAIMFGAAVVFDWYRKQQRVSRSPHPQGVKS